MSGYSSAEIWGMIAALALGTYLIRLSFLGLIGRDGLPPVVLRVLRYTPVAVLPAMVIPLVVWPEGPGSHPDAIRIAAALVTVLVGWRTKQTIWAAAAGGTTLGLGVAFLG